MKTVNKLGFQLSVPVTNQNLRNRSLGWLEKFHEDTLSKARLRGYTNELGNDENFRNNLYDTEPTFADCYYFPKVGPEISIRELIGPDDSNFFKNIYQVCVFLEAHWENLLRRYRDLKVNEGRTCMLFPFKNFLGQKCSGSIDAGRGGDSFYSGINFDKSEHKDYGAGYFGGHGERSLMIVLPFDNKATFLKNNDFEVCNDYKLLSLGDFQKRIKIISETSKKESIEKTLYYTGVDKIEERIRVELSYTREICLYHPSTEFVHPEGSFLFSFK